MRDIKFRGKSFDNGEFVFGDLTRYSEEMSYITVDLIEGEVYQVDSKTVGQFTGLKDKNGKEIYEGDIILDNEITFDFITADNMGDVRIISRQHTVKYNQATCGLMRFNENSGYFTGNIGLYSRDGLEVIGNIYENPELLEIHHED